jgi:cyanophycinase-like exopeptidase
MSPGTIGLHGGGELVRGDEPFLRAILRRAAEAAPDRRASGTSPGHDGGTPGDAGDAGGVGGGVHGRATIRVVVLPVAAGGERPELAVAHAKDAFLRTAAELALAVEVVGVAVVDERSAADPEPAAIVAAADLVYLPGGDPGRAARSLRASRAGRAVLAAHALGATIAGASAGAMALCGWAWTPDGGETGLGLVPGVVVVPHADRFADAELAGTRAWARGAPADAGILALDERTGVLSGASGAGGRWQVAGRGRAAWIEPGGTPVVARDGEEMDLPA